MSHHNEDDPIHNAHRLREIASVNPSGRINIDKGWALKIASQLEGLHAECRKNFDALCRTEAALNKALIQLRTKGHL